MNSTTLNALALGLGLALNPASMAAAELLDAETLFDRYFAAIGGRDAASSIKTVTVIGVARGPERPLDFTLQIKSPGSALLTLREASGKSARQGRDRNARCWRQDADGVHDLDDSGAAALVGLSLAFNPSGQVDLGERLADAVCEADDDGGRPVVAIGRKKPAGLFPRIVFDSASGLIVSAGNARLEDYRVIQGLRLPHIVQMADGRTYEVRSVVFNDPLADALFERPGGRGGWLGQIGSPAAVPVPVARTQLSAPGRLEIVRRPAAAHLGKGRLTEMPHWDPAAGMPFQVDLRGADLRALDLTKRKSDLLHADFDSHTRWPQELPGDFDRGAVLELGRNPGLGVRALHRQGVTGRGVGIGLIDFPLLTEHEEYADRLRLYEELHSPGGMAAHMHGTAVSSIAAGKTCGVAPEADLYFIALQAFNYTPGKGLQTDFALVGKAIERLLDINRGLPADRKIRVISISMGWTPGEQGYPEVMESVQRASRDGVFVLSTALRDTHRLRFDGLGRKPLADPDEPQSYGPGSWWASQFWSGQMRFKPGKRLCVPMDSRTTASPTGPHDFVRYNNAGWSWAVPWLAGLYTLGCQVRPELTPQQFWAEALRTGHTTQIRHGQEQVDFGTIANPVALIHALQRPAQASRGEAVSPWAQ